MSSPLAKFFLTCYLGRMNELEKHAEAEAERRWPSPNTAFYDGLRIGFKLGYMSRVADQILELED